MPYGVLIDNVMVALGGFLGAALGNHLSETFKDRLYQILGYATMAIGITLVIKVQTLGAVILSVILGFCIGSALRLEERVTNFFAGLNQVMMGKNRPDEEYMASFTTILVLCCCSGTGIFGSMNAALTGDHTTILCKAILDFFTVMIFATVLGRFTSVIAVPQMIILLLLFFGAKLIMPFLTDQLISDFTAVGGVIELIIAFRILKLGRVTTVDVLPGLFLVFPISLLWRLVF